MRFQLALVLVVAIAGDARAALFTFDDLPSVFPPIPIAPGGTDAYSCGGQGFCTADDLEALTSGGRLHDTLSTTVDGITGTFSIPERGIEVWGEARALSVGNDPAWFDLFLADFDTDLIYFEAFLQGNDSAELTSLAVELWSGPNGTGTLVASVIVDPEGPQSALIEVSAPDGTTFRSAYFGVVLNDLPDCRTNCVHPIYEYSISNSGTADNILVRPIPEPTSVASFAAGALLVGACLWHGTRGSSLVSERRISLPH